ncbi:MAG: 4-hydroxy-tetrahydrodipicolinate reductase [Spirochaetaceae bacterium]|jgi:4-hydroxy-tetrahydrodipicolinate reductase|nr:4-hydroxy-tetrahydrodipicolinate reductase [Spirochaetaceae bacterium]
MVIALIGYGKMGRLLEVEALNRGHRIGVIIDPYPAVEETRSGIPVERVFPEKGEGKRAEALEKADVAIEFTRPDTAVENIKTLARWKLPVVTGTTGWYERLPEVTKLIHDAESSLLWSSNFSLGVNLFYRIAAYAAAVMDPFREYDVGGLETHHNKKADSPSGTAKLLAEQVLSRMSRKKRVVWDTLNRPPSPEELHFSSLRTGSIPGIHSLFFDSPADTIEITHTARNREGFALGALQAAEWLISGRAHDAPSGAVPAGAGTALRHGVFTMDDVLKDMLESPSKSTIF